MEPADRCLRRLLTEEPQVAQQQQLPFAQGTSHHQDKIQGELPSCSQTYSDVVVVFLCRGGSGGGALRGVRS